MARPNDLRPHFDDVGRMPDGQPMYGCVICGALVVDTGNLFSNDPADPPLRHIDWHRSLEVDG